MTVPAPTGQIRPSDIDYFAGQKMASKAVKRVFGHGDSLIDGSGDGSTLMTTLATKLRSTYGDAGVGNVVTTLGKLNGSGLGKTAGVLYTTDLAWGDTTFKKYTANGNGMYVSAGAGSDNWSYYLQSGDGLGAASLLWTSVRLCFFLKDSGSSFTFGQGDSVPGNRFTVSSTNFDVGVPQSLVWNFNPANNGGVRVDAITGNVLFQSLEYQNSATPLGVQVANYGLGGTKALDLATSLDDATQTLWWKHLAPDAMLIDLGMNDRTASSPYVFAKSMDRIIQRILANGKTKICLIRPNDPSDAGTTNMQYYDKILQGLAMSYGLGYADDRDVLGNYAAAVAASLMYDTVHPNTAGNVLRGNWHGARMQL